MGFKLVNMKWIGFSLDINLIHFPQVHCARPSFVAALLIASQCFDVPGIYHNNGRICFRSIITTAFIYTHPFSRPAYRHLFLNLLNFSWTKTPWIKKVNYWVCYMQWSWCTRCSLIMVNSAGKWSLLILTSSTVVLSLIGDRVTIYWFVIMP